MQRYKFLFFLFSLLQIYCAEPKTNSKSENSNSHKKLNNTENTFNKILNMSMDEMDKLMGCTFLIQEGLKKQNDELEATIKRLNISKKVKVKVAEKAGTEIFTKCVNKIDISDINVFMKNITYLGNFTWQEKFNELVKVDFSQYNNISDFELTPSERLLVNKYQKVDEFSRRRRADEQAQKEDVSEFENEKIKIGNLDIDSIPKSVKMLVFLGIFGLFFGGLIYLLKSMDKKKDKKDKKDKKKKKTQ